MITSQEFIRLYWGNYILLEKEFIKTIEYVSIDEENYATYSKAYAKLLLEIEVK